MMAAVILAAGSSSRLGEPKQALLYKGKPLIQHMIDVALQSDCRPLVVVVGANRELISSYIPHADVRIVYNQDWEHGIGTSIKSAITYLFNDFDVDAALFLVCDQPFVDAPLIQTILHKKQETGKAIVACSYGNTVGVPALFNRTMFNHLLLLGNDEGAKKVITNHPGDLVTVPFDKGITDIDTRDDYDDLLSAE